MSYITEFLSQERREYIYEWELDSDLWGGRTAMRQAGERRLPRLPAELPERHYIRMMGARLLPAYSNAVRYLAGRLREVAPMPGPEVPAPLVDWFWRQKFSGLLHDLRLDGLRHGSSFVLCDVGDSGEPVVTLIPARDVLEAFPEQGPLTYVRFVREERRPGGEQPIRRIYIIQKVEKGVEVLSYLSDGEFRFHLEDELVLPHQNLPVQKFQYSEEMFRPYFADLAALNEAHWQSTAYQVHAEAFARFNIVWGSKLGDELQLSGVGPHALVVVEEGGSLHSLEGGGAGIEAGRRDLTDLENQMATLSSRPFTSDGIKTATEVNRSTQQEDAPIRRIAEMEIEALRNILKIVAEMMELEVPDPLDSDILGNTEFRSLENTPQDAQNLLSSYVSGGIDRQTYLQGVVKAIPSISDIDPADIADRLGGGDGVN